MINNYESRLCLLNFFNLHAHLATIFQKNTGVVDLNYPTITDMKYMGGKTKFIQISIMDINSKYYRYTILLLNCLLTFGSYYCFDMPANLQNHITEEILQKFTKQPNEYYNLFYLVYSWTNMFMSLCSGVLVDKFGKERCMYLFLSFCLVGSAIYALGTALVGINAMYR